MPGRLKNPGKEFITTVANDNSVWTSAEVVGMLLGLRRSMDLLPWYVKPFLRQWNAALEAAVGLFVTCSMILAEGNAFNDADLFERAED